MKTIVVLLFLTLLTFRLGAQVYEIKHFKTAAYSQTNGSPPVTTDFPNSYYFGSSLSSDPSYGLSLPMVFTPSTNTSGEFIMNQNGPGYFGFGSPIYSNLMMMDADYPGGEYDYATTYIDVFTNDVADDFYVEAPTNDFFSTTIPAFTPSCWAGMKNFDPAVSYNLAWVPYSQMPGTDYAYTFIGTYDSQTFSSFYGGFNYSCDPSITSTVIPAGSFEYGRTYVIQLFYSNRLTQSQPNDDGSYASIIIGFDDQTHTFLTTIPPPLHIAPEINLVTLSWPQLAAANYKLQSSPSLSSPSWLDVTNLPSLTNSTYFLSLPTTNAAAFFRLAPQ